MIRSFCSYKHYTAFVKKKQLCCAHYAGNVEGRACAVEGGGLSFVEGPHFRVLDIFLRKRVYWPQHAFYNGNRQKDSAYSRV
jgi:hypothetical protein